MSSKARLSSGALALALAGCGGLSDVGEQPELAPTAVAQVVNYAGADASGNVSANVRARTEVLLTGKESLEADKPILSFVWAPANAAAGTAPITVRNSNTINVSVPAVTAPTVMQFRLTVTDSDGDTDDSVVTLNVQPVLDSDRFLSFIDRDAKLRFVAATPQPATAGGHFSMQLRAKVTYATRPSSGANRIMNSIEYDLGGPIEGDWAPSNAPAVNPPESDFRNPLLQAPVPAVNTDDIIRAFQRTLPASESSMPDPAFIDDATIEVIARLTTSSAIGSMSLTALNADGSVVATASNGGTGTPVELRLTPAAVDLLRLNGGGLENSETAASYYRALDPDGRKTTLRDWLAENCFNASAANLGADAHALYVNNFDLGFGRDMYFIGTKPANCTSASFAAGNAASVVINYPTLEAAAKKVDPVIAVAMEYLNADANRGTPGTVVFYIFAPDEGTGEFRRVRSANFDGRGEKYLPGACVMCHGGRPRTNAPDRRDPYASGDVNVGATFMPWDLESFLYSDTDPAFPTDPSNAALRDQFTRARQEAEFKKLNLGVLATYGSRSGANVTCHAGFTGPCDLVKLWYGDNLAAPTFVNNAVGKGWRTGFVGTGNPLPLPNPASAETLYRDVYARNCRACHTQRVIELDSNELLDPQFASYSDFLRETDNIHRLVFDEGYMPGARLSADRFWTSATNGETAGAALARHLGFNPAVVPGATVARMTVSQISASPPSIYTALVADSTDPAILVANRNRALRIDGSDSVFPRAFTQSVEVPMGSAAILNGLTSQVAQLVPDVPGTYTFTLNAAPGGGRATFEQVVTVVNLPPVIPSSVSFNVDQGASITVPPAGILNGASDDDGDTLIVTPTSGSATCPAVAHAVQLTVQSDGGFFYRNNGSLAATDQFEVSVTDGYVAQTMCVNLTIISVADTQLPSAPGLNPPSAGNVDNGANSRFPVTLTWTAATDTDQFGNSRELQGYRVFRQGPTGPEVPVGNTLPGELAFTDNSAGNVLLPNRVFTYRVAAVDLNGNSMFSAGRSVTTRSSYRQNVHPIWASTLGCSGCHTFLQGSADSMMTAGSTFLGLTVAGPNAATGTLPCRPAGVCTSHPPGNILLSDPNDTSLGGVSYRQIIKWLQEGRHNN